MANCRECASFDWCAENEDCFLFNPKAQPKTEGDKIRTMTGEELASLFSDFRHEHWCPPNAGDCAEYCTDCWLDWLRQEGE